MFTRILVPLDGSVRAERAIDAAARIARSTNGTVLLFRSVPITPEYGPYFTPAVPLSAGGGESDVADAEHYLKQIAAEEPLRSVRTEFAVNIGSAPNEILAAIQAQQADSVIMCSHGRSGAMRWMLGSVAEHVSRHSPVPTLILRDAGKDLFIQKADPEHLPRVLVALDGSAQAEDVLEPAAQLAVDFGAGLHLVVVISPLEAIEDEMPDALVVDGAKTYLRGIADKVRDKYVGLPVTWTVGLDVDIAGTIIRVAERGDDTEGAGAFGGCDVIAMSTHGRTGMARWALGSVTERVLHATRLPLLIVRAHSVGASKWAELSNVTTGAFQSTGNQHP